MVVAKHRAGIQALPMMLWVLCLVYFLLRISFNTQYGFHRDEFLYLAQGNHPAWGYWSNAPLPGLVSFVVQRLLGDSIWAIRFVPALLAATTALMTALTARELGGSRFAQLLAAFSIMISGAFLRVFLLYNPVGFDVFFWTLFTYVAVRLLNRGEKHWVIILGLMMGIGFLNKYSVVFVLLPLLMIFPFSTIRPLVLSKEGIWGVLAALFVVTPNLLWQYAHGFPVIGHMQELQENQLQNVNRIEFLVDQVLFNLNVLPVWVAGFFYFFRREGRRFRDLGVLFVLVILLLLLLKGKSYYTLGIYPIMIAAGAAWWGEVAVKRKWVRPVIIGFSILNLLPVSPYTWPFLPPEKMVAFGQYGPDAFRRWEDGQLHALPQDYADMFGWDEMARLVYQAYEASSDPSRTVIYCSNFGQAGAVDHYGKEWSLPAVLSFADSWLLWLPEISEHHNALIYVNDELGEDVQELFADIKQMGMVENDFARERGTTVWLCQQPRRSLQTFLQSRIAEVKANRGLTE
ncbi:MAG: glycosyltransferase family 39 protein [Saprospiraceae bacterium]|nr:glycosyltransferase family 39 protein [Saprospiraceae bacterium]